MRPGDLVKDTTNGGIFTVVEIDYSDNTAKIGNWWSSYWISFSELERI